MPEPYLYRSLEEGQRAGDGSPSARPDDALDNVRTESWGGPEPLPSWRSLSGAVDQSLKELVLYDGAKPQPVIKADGSIHGGSVTQPVIEEHLSGPHHWNGTPALSPSEAMIQELGLGEKVGHGNVADTMETRLKQLIYGNTDLGSKAQELKFDPLTAQVQEALIQALQQSRFDGLAAQHLEAVVQRLQQRTVDAVADSMVGKPGFSPLRFAAALNLGISPQELVDSVNKALGHEGGRPKPGTRILELSISPLEGGQVVTVQEPYRMGSASYLITNTPGLGYSLSYIEDRR